MPSVPGNSPFQAVKGCRPPTAVAEPIAVIATFDDMEEPAGRPRIRVVVHGEEVSGRVERHVEGVPEPGGDPFQPRAVRPASVDIATLSASRERDPIAADQAVVGTQVLAQPEIDQSPRIEREPRESVVWIVPLRNPAGRSGRGPCLLRCRRRGRYRRGLRAGRLRPGSRRRPSRRAPPPGSWSTWCPRRRCRPVRDARRGPDLRRRGCRSARGPL